MPSRSVDEIVLARHSSGVRITLAPEFNNGQLCVWLDRGGYIRKIATYRNRKRLAAWLRKAADAVEKA